MKTDKKKIQLEIEGMSCTNCALGIKKHLESKGFENVSVNFATREASYNLNNKLSEKDAEDIITQLGYNIILKTKTKQKLKIKVEKQVLQ